MANWTNDVIWWHVYPLGFVGAEHQLADVTGEQGPQALADAPVAHRLPALHGWLDYLLSLGCNGLALAPVFASESHGYDTVDFYRVDPRLGDEDDLVALIDACHAKGIKVLLDGVFNHVGRGHHAFQEVLREGPGAGTASWFHLTWPGGPDAWHPGTVPDYATFEGHGQLVALDHGAPAVADYVADVMTYWLDRGADGWRLDAAYAVDPDFWSRVLPRVRERHPDAYIVGEVIHGDYADVVRRSGMDAVTQYELWKATWSSLNDANLWELDHALGRHNGFLEAFVPYTFVGNHDVTRIASRLTDPRHVGHAIAVLFTLGGTPAVYYGDEQGYRGVKEERFGGDDQIRPLFPSRPEELSDLGADVLRSHRELIGVRRRHRWLHHARTTRTHLDNTSLTYDVSGSLDGESGRLSVALNIADEPRRLPVSPVREVLAGVGHIEGEDGTAVVLQPHTWAVLR